MVLINKRLAYHEARDFCSQLGGTLSKDSFTNTTDLKMIGSESDICGNGLWVPIVQGPMRRDGSFQWMNDITGALFVFLNSDPKQNARSLLTPVSDPAFHALSHGSLGFSLNGSFLNHFLLVEIFQQPIRIFEISGSWSYHGEENACYHVKEHKKLGQKLVSKVTLHFVWGR